MKSPLSARQSAAVCVVGLIASALPDWLVKNRPMPAGPRPTFTTFNFHKKNDDLPSSGLLGPVTLLLESRITIK